MRNRLLKAATAATIGWLILMAVFVWQTKPAPALGATSVTLTIRQDTPMYGTPIPCGTTTHAASVFVTVNTTSFGPAPQTTLDVSLDGTLVWSFRSEPGGLRNGSHEDGWSYQLLNAAGAWTFKAYAYDNPSVAPARCVIYK